MTNRGKTIALQGGRRKGLFYGWWVVAALFVVGIFSPMGRLSLTAFAPFIQEELPWTKSQIGMAFSIHLWVYSFLCLLIGWMIDRFGSRRVIFVGGFILLIGWTCVSKVSTLWQLYLFFGVITALGASMTHVVPGYATVRKWFIKKAGLVVGIVAAAMSVGGAILVPVLTVLAGSVGWRITWLISALGFGIIIMLLAWLVIRDSPESMGLHPYGMAEAPSETDVTSPVAGEAVWSTREVLHTSSFWLLLAAICLPAIGWHGMLTQVVMWAVDLGEPLATAGVFVTAFTLPGIPVSILGGWLGDRYGKRRMLILAFCVCSLALIGAWLTVSSRSSLLMIAILVGITEGFPIVLHVPYLGDLYGRASLGTLVGIRTFGRIFVGGFGPLIWGWIADITGSYNLACLVSAIAYVIGVVILMFLKPEKLARRR